MPVHSQLEVRVLGIIDRVKRGEPVEDSYVELKRQWPEATKEKRYEFTRQIAAHANAARGAQILWVIGVHERTPTIPGAGIEELAVFLDIFKSHFDGLAPSLLESIVVPTVDAPVVALLFDTSRAPYVLTGTDIRRPDKEVPWREGTSARTATREHLVRLLAPMSVRPRCDIINVTIGEGSAHGDKFISCMVHVYVSVPGGGQAIFPLHMCSMTLGIPGRTDTVDFKVDRLLPTMHAETRKASVTVVESATETIVSGAGLMLAHGVRTSALGKLVKSELHITTTLHALDVDSPIVLRVELSPAEPEAHTGQPRWVIKQSGPQRLV
ncbi:hypothetical protein [Sorangium sp. So ce128]|uniref:hypothetical protein n=1 Tax=Sorangium sp. So ce128 TaxID=3133281 RepID=UPI003F5FBD07